MAYEDRFRDCAVCGEMIGAKGYVRHSRLGVVVCETCPLDNVNGEDIRLHTLFWDRPYVAWNGTIEERGDFD
jgi:hypothetical protein